MRFLNKYKIHEHYASAERKLPKRVNNFKRPKWVKIKKKLWFRKYIWKKGHRLWIRPKFINHIKIGVAKKYYLKNFFKTKLHLKKYLASLFDNNMSIKKESKIKDRTTTICFYLIKPFYRIDIILWYLKFFHSSLQARIFVNSGKVLINDKIVGPNYFLKKGDVISFTLNFIDEKKNRRFFIRSKYKPKTRELFPFLEYDYYTNTILVLKNWNELTKNELALTTKRGGKKLKYATYK